MITTDQLLESIQADILAVLKSVPGLATAAVLADDKGDIEAEVARALGTVTETGGKCGLAVVVLLPEINTAEANLPGPVMQVAVEVRTIEHVLINRNADTGTQIRSSQAALRVLAALHLRDLGGRLLYAQRDPVSPVDVKAGHVSHAVTLHCRENGTSAAGKVAAPTAGWEQSTAAGLWLSGAGTPAFDGFYQPAGELNGRPRWQHADTPAIQVLWSDDAWQIDDGSVPSVGGYTSDEDVATPDLVESWTPHGPGTIAPAPTVEPGGSLTLACATAGAAIYYTTDGSYPTPTNGVLYDGPVTGLPTGTTVRAAAYAADMTPSDLTELEIIES